MRSRQPEGPRRRRAARSLAGWAFGALLAAAVLGEELTVVDYNAWHGTFRAPGQGTLRLPSESKAHRVRRWRLQDELLAVQRPDVVFLQEVNPLPRRARRLARSLGLVEVHKTTDCGVKLFGLGVPVNIRSGLAILARPELRLRRLGTPRLSGRRAFCSDWFGLQLEEGRSALLAGVTLPGGRSLLLVSTHLHNAPGLPEELAAGIAALRASGRLTEQQVAAIFDRVEAGRRRQLAEAERLVAAIEAAQARHPGLDGVLLGGDFNAEPSSPPLARLAEAGLVSAARLLGVEVGATSEADSNDLRRVLVERTGARIPTFGVAELEALELATRLASREEIDHLLVSRRLAPALRAIELFGRPGKGEEEGVAAERRERFPFPLVSSDHYGLRVRLDLALPAPAPAGEGTAGRGPGQAPHRSPSEPSRKAG